MNSKKNKYTKLKNLTSLKLDEQVPLSFDVGFVRMRMEKKKREHGSSPSLCVKVYLYIFS